jgi:tripartite-type tricarboxylate transporter receptor subunit TctC
MLRVSRRQFMGAGVLAPLAACCAPAVHAQGRYPERRIRVIAPNAAGGVGDSVIRALAPRMEEKLGQKLVIESKPGAAGNIGMLEIARADADGYTILLGAANNFVINQFLTKLSFDPLIALTPIAKVAEIPIIFFSNSSVPARDLGDFITYARTNPGKLNYGSPGIGTVNHLLVERLKQVAGIEITHVPYRGSPPAMLGLLANEIQLFPVGLALGGSHLGQGAVRALAVAMETRMPMLPDVPSVIEAGLPALTISNWWALAAPSGTPEPIIRLLNQAVLEALRDSIVVERFAALGMLVPTQTREQFASSLGSEAEQWAQIIRRGKIAIE